MAIREYYISRIFLIELKIGEIGPNMIWKRLKNEQNIVSKFKTIEKASDFVQNRITFTTHFLNLNYKLNTAFYNLL